MAEEFQVTWEGLLPATPEVVWDAVTRHSEGWLWAIEYEPRLGGAERGLSGGGGTVTAWEPGKHFATEAPETNGFNKLDYVFEARNHGTYLTYTHNGVMDDDVERQVDACRQHTAFYYHSLGEYVAHFAGRDSSYVSLDAPESSAKGGTTAITRALGLPDTTYVGERVHLTPDGLPAIEGVVDYVSPAFLGIRTADALYRIYGRDYWGWPAGVAHHFFDPATAGTEEAWRTWLDGVFTQ